MARYNVNDDLTMWVGHESVPSERMQMGNVSVSGTYTGLPDMTLGFNAMHGADSRNFQVGVDMDSMNGGVALDHNMNMSLNYNQTYGETVSMNTWFRLPW